MAMARRFYVRGRVQGVGYRDFAQRAARQAGIVGHARNLEDGRVEVYGVGTREQLELLAAQLGQGPRGADVRGVEQEDAEMLHYEGFVIRH